MPEMQKVMKERYNSEIVATFGFPQQVFFCRDDINGVADLKGKKIRVQGVSQSDLAKAFGASAVTIPFGEVVPALEKGVVDCGITGTMPGYQAKWTEVVKTLLTMPVGFTAGIWVMNLNSFNKLSKPTQEFMRAEFKKLEDQVLGDRRKRKRRGYRLQHRQRPLLDRPARQAQARQSRQMPISPLATRRSTRWCWSNGPSAAGRSAPPSGPKSSASRSGSPRRPTDGQRVARGMGAPAD